MWGSCGDNRVDLAACLDSGLHRAAAGDAQDAQQAIFAATLTCTF